MEVTEDSDRRGRARVAEVCVCEQPETSTQDGHTPEELGGRVGAGRGWLGRIRAEPDPPAWVPGRRLGARVLPRRGGAAAGGGRAGWKEPARRGRPLRPLGEAVGRGREKRREGGSAELARQAKTEQLRGGLWTEILERGELRAQCVGRLQWGVKSPGAVGF